MAGNGDSITTKFKVDISDLKKNITEANRNMKLANAEFKAASTGMKVWEKSSTGISTKLKQLNSVLTDQKAKLAAYQQQQERVDKAYEALRKCDIAIIVVDALTNDVELENSFISKLNPSS